MATQALVMKAVDALITSYVQRLVVRIEYKLLRSEIGRIPMPGSPWNHLSDAEFISKEEWDLLKVLATTQDDEMIIRYINKNYEYKSALSHKYSFMSMQITLNENSHVMYCIIKATNKRG